MRKILRSAENIIIQLEETLYTLAKIEPCLKQMHSAVLSYSVLVGIATFILLLIIIKYII